MNKAALLQLEHFNKSNALAWALTMGLFAMPVVYSDREWNQMVGESYYIQLGPGRPVRVDGAGGQGLPDRGGQPGAAEGRNLPGLLPDEPGERDGRGASAQSGLSKQRDFSVTQEVLRAYGDDGEGRDEAGAAGDRGGAAGRGLRSMSRGWTSSTSAISATSWTMRKKLLELGIGSETLKKQVFKKLALKYLCDARQEIKNQVAEEIEAEAERSKERREFAERGRRPARLQATSEQRQEVYGRHRHSSDCAAGDSGVREQRAGEERAGVQGGAAGGAEAAGATGAAGERTGGREQAQPARWRRKRSGARRSGRSCSGWAWRRSIWRSKRCRTGSCGPRTGGW